MIKLPVYDWGITLNELPTEIALFFQIANCTAGCRGCHSPFLWVNQADIELSYLDTAQLLEIIHRYKQKITAVVFMGGLSNGVEPTDAIKVIKSIAKRIPTGLYTDSLHNLNQDELLFLRWLKVGRYDSKCGGLNQQTTNQRFYERQFNKKKGVYEWNDKTECRFQRTIIE